MSDIVFRSSSIAILPVLNHIAVRPGHSPPHSRHSTCVCSAPRTESATLYKQPSTTQVLSPSYITKLLTLSLVFCGLQTQLCPPAYRINLSSLRLPLHCLRQNLTFTSQIQYYLMFTGKTIAHSLLLHETCLVNAKYLEPDIFPQLLDTSFKARCSPRLELRQEQQSRQT